MHKVRQAAEQALWSSMTRAFFVLLKEINQEKYPELPTPCTWGIRIGSQCFPSPSCSMWVMVPVPHQCQGWSWHDL